MSVIKQKYTAKTDLAMGLDGLANSSVRLSAPVNNADSDKLFMDILIQVKLKTIASVAATAYCNVYVYESSDDGANYTDGLTAAEATVTVNNTNGNYVKNPTNLVFLGAVNTPGASMNFVSKSFSLAAAFGGVIPKYWGLAVENKTGYALSGTAGEDTDNFATYQGVHMETV